ncbi:MAG: histidine kinase [Rhizobiales bacterium]|nr:histidine kinase [Hyphomicrobiales bacterium]MDQ3558005.1 ATP-binding protein [Pseudomonadota bacterium]
MRARSLSLRVALIAAGGSALALIVAGAVFIYQFSTAVERNFDARLETLLLTLITATSAEGEVDENAVEGRSGGTFSRPLSGWYWQVREADTGRALDWSESLRFDILPVRDLPTETEPARTFTIQASGGRQLRALEQLVTLGESRTFALLVAGDTEPMTEDVRAFRNSVIRVLGGLAVLFALGTALLVRWGLTPLRGVRDDLNKIREGEIGHLEGRYPREIEPLVHDLNALLNSNREIIERARTHVGNLAHALKTPLAVLQNETRGASEPLAAKVGEQVAIMRDQVEHHLNRARMAAQANVIGAVTPVAPIVGGLARVMGKVHQERHLDIQTHVAAELRFRGEKHDLEEMAGNLFDNACKWAASRVRVSAGRREIGRRPFLTIGFEDDGPGLPAEGREEALSRGARLDESKPGSGLGLSIVAELARIYGGSLSLEDSELGGLAARLTLPAPGD